MTIRRTENNNGAMETDICFIYVACMNEVTTNPTADKRYSHLYRSTSATVLIYMCFLEKTENYFIKQVLLSLLEDQEAQIQ